MNLVLAIIRHLRAILLVILLVVTRLRLLVTTTIATKGELRHRPRIGMPMLLRRLLLLLLHGRGRPLVCRRLVLVMTTIGPLGTHLY